MPISHASVISADTAVPFQRSTLVSARGLARYRERSYEVSFLLVKECFKYRVGVRFH